MILRVKGDQVTMVYDERLDLSGLGTATIRRASHVEPDTDGLWRAELSPSGGPTLGPFAKRSKALSAEHVWLEEHLSSI